MTLLLLAIISSGLLLGRMVARVLKLWGDTMEKEILTATGILARERERRSE